MTMEDNLRERIDNWLRGVEKEIEIGEHDAAQLESYLEDQMDDAETSSRTNPEEAYGKVVKLASVASHMARRKPALVDLLNRYVQRFVSVMNTVKKALGAVSFSITVSFPFDLSISLTF